MTRGQKFLLRLQAILSWLFYVFIGGPLFWLFFRFFSIKVYHKERLRDLSPPFILVSNHLSLIDSWFGGYAVCWPQMYYKPWLMTWNMPEATNYFRGPLAIFIWLSRSIPIVRGGKPREVALSLKKAVEALKNNEPIYIFPEGTRSRTGRLTNYTTGIGRIYKEVANCTVLPIYLRGVENVLPIGEKVPRLFKKIDILIGEPVKITTKYHGLSATDDISRQIFELLIKLEKEYFSAGSYRV